jgi:CheY-like chemotaxis protein
MQSASPPLEGSPNSASAGLGVELGHATQDSLQRAKPAADWICVAAARNILVIDDNDRHLDILSTILSSVGHDVETCGSGAEAIRRLETRRYDVVVLDLVMPEVSGLIVAQEMRSGELNKRTPIIACTANMTLARRQLGEISGISAVIGKPIDTASLILAVARAPVRDRRSDQIRL